MGDLARRYLFFREHAGYVVGESARCAIDLARAEARAEDLGLTFRWEGELESYESVFGDPLPDDVDGPYWVSCELDGESLASIGMVTLARRNDPYRRVVEADLAREALSILDAREELANATRARRREEMSPGAHYQASNQRTARAHETMLDLMYGSNPITRDELVALIRKRPEAYLKYAAHLKNLKRRAPRFRATYAGVSP